MKELELKELIQAAVAQGWCVPPNTHKEMDCALAEAIVNKVLKALDTHDAAILEQAAQVCDNYGRDGRLSKEYACETADEIAARIRALKREKRGGE